MYKRRAIAYSLALLGVLGVVIFSLSSLHVNKDNITDAAPFTVIQDIQTCTKTLFNWCRLPDKSWQRYEKDLFLGSKWFKKTYVIYKHVSSSVLTSKDSVVVELRTRATHETDSESLEWDLVDERFGIWVKRAPYTNVESSVTAIKVLFGQDIRYPLQNWHACPQSMSAGRDRYSMPSMFYRLGAPLTVRKPQLEFNPQGKLRIAQVSDLHMTTGYGECRDVAPPTGEDKFGVCLGDALTTKFLLDGLSTEKPDLIVFSGDLINGTESADPESALLKAVLPAIELQIPFTAIWGNHDPHFVDNFALTNMLMELPYSVMEHGPDNVSGDGNYVLTIGPVNKPEVPALSLYLMDSHSKEELGYDWVRKDQAEYFAAEGAAIAARLEGWEGYNLSMAFLHIPTAHFLFIDEETRVGDMRERPITGGKDEGIMSALANAGVSVFLAGHDHVNDFCQFLYKNKRSGIDRDMYVCYAGGAGYAAYGREPENGYGLYQRRFRVFDIDLEEGVISTYHRIDKSIEKTHHFKLVVNGNPIPPR